MNNTTYRMTRPSVDQTGETATIPAGTDVRLLAKDENGCLVETLDGSVSFYVNEADLIALR